MFFEIRIKYLEQNISPLPMPKLNFKKHESQLFVHFVSSELGGRSMNYCQFALTDPFYFSHTFSSFNSKDFLLKHFSSWGTLCR